MNVGFIGLGTMGASIALNAIKGGNTLTVVMGDMNAVTGAPKIELFRDAGLVDAASLTGAPPAPTRVRAFWPLSASRRGVAVW